MTRNIKLFFREVLLALLKVTLLFGAAFALTYSIMQYPVTTTLVGLVTLLVASFLIED